MTDCDSTWTPDSRLHDEDRVSFDEEWRAWRKPYWQIYQDTPERFHDILDDLFMSVYWRAQNIPKKELERGFGYADADGFHYYRCWHYRDNLDLAADSTTKSGLYIDNETLMVAVERYRKTPEMHTEYLDWFCASALTYGELYPTIFKLQTQLLGFLGAVIAAMASQTTGVLVSWLMSLASWLLAAYLAFLGPTAGEWWALLIAAGIVFGTIHSFFRRR